MDPITHAASGALFASVIKERPATKWFLPLAALTAASPDIDVIFAHAPLDFLLLHRGITHAFAAVPFMALLISLCMYPLWNKKTPHAFSLGKTYLFAACLLLLHIWLDVVTTYGTLALLPFSEYRVRLNGVFIIDILVTLPIFAAIYWGQKQKKWAVLGLIWIFIYPSACVFWRMHLEDTALARLTNAGQNIEKIAVLPDAFAPLYWRLIYENDENFTPNKNTSNAPYTAKNMQGFSFAPAANTVWHQGLNALGSPRTELIAYPALPKEIAQSLSEQSERGLAYMQFSLIPTFELRPLSAETPLTEAREVAIYDLRFSSMLPFVIDLMHKRNNGEPTFLFLGKQQENTWTDVRLIFSGSGKDSLWQKPVPPQKPTWWQWLLGAAPPLKLQ